MTATQFEQYAGAGSAKKWKTSLRILPGQVPECPPGVPAAHLPTSLAPQALGAPGWTRTAPGTHGCTLGTAGQVA